MTIARDSRTRSEHVIVDTDDVATTLYTCPANCKAHMSLLFINNPSANASDIAIEWAVNGTDYFIIGGKNLDTGEFLQFADAFIVLEASDLIKITTTNTAGGNAPDIHVFCTVEEFFLPEQSGVR